MQNTVHPVFVRSSRQNIMSLVALSLFPGVDAAGHCAHTFLFLSTGKSRNNSFADGVKNDFGGIVKI
jgi:hypothetical protein